MPDGQLRDLEEEWLELQLPAASTSCQNGSAWIMWRTCALFGAFMRFIGKHSLVEKKAELLYFSPHRYDPTDPRAGRG